MGLFGKTFDLNHDGKMDSFEKAAELGFLNMMMQEEKKQRDWDRDLDDDEDEED